MCLMFLSMIIHGYKNIFYTYLETVVLAHRGFKTVLESMEMYCAKVNTPLFRGGEKQPSRLKLMHHDNSIFLGFMWRGLLDSFDRSTQYLKPGYQAI